MSGTSTSPTAVLNNWIVEHREIYIRSGGVEGHIVDLTAVGGRSFSTHCLVKHRGRKSGKIFITPLSYADIGGEVVICASKGGSDVHPAWYLNLIAAEQVEFQIATQAFRATWREPEGEERDRVWAFVIGSFPFYADYQASTSRLIPLVMMKAIDPVERFVEADAPPAQHN
ncbi:MAG: nitroreductase family deazaflavin-dependent oxidoreductase [Verrucomicrobiaceae bacterium]|nr:MAG: nitroreductase family deazaflavin-dependent oxidoreductase [Verrucomicrobiaceae bacterium]